MGLEQQRRLLIDWMLLPVSGGGICHNLCWPPPPNFHLTSVQRAHHTLPEGAASSHPPSCGMNDSPSAPEVGSDWLKPSAYLILLVHDWFRAGHMTQLRPMRGEMFAGVSGERIARSPLGELPEGTRAFLPAPGSEGHEGPGVKATLEERMSERWSLAGSTFAGSLSQQIPTFV